MDIFNAMTMKQYKGKNIETLAGFMRANGFLDNRFATMKQWNGLNRAIIAGSKSCVIGFVDFGDESNQRRNDRGYVFKTYRVFNIEQTRPYTEEERIKFERGNESNHTSVTL